MMAGDDESDDELFRIARLAGSNLSFNLSHNNHGNVERCSLVLP